MASNQTPKKRHNLLSLGKAAAQILLSDDPAEGFGKLASELKEEARKELGEYSGDHTKPTLTAAGETVEDNGNGTEKPTT